MSDDTQRLYDAMEEAALTLAYVVGLPIDWNTGDLATTPRTGDTINPDTVPGAAKRAATAALDYLTVGLGVLKTTLEDSSTDDVDGAIAAILRRPDGQS